MKVCPNCSKKIQDEATVCPYCGEKLTPTLLSKIVANPKYRAGSIAGIVILVVLLSAGIYYANLKGLFTPQPSCYAQSQDYLNAFMPLFSQWNEITQNIHNLRKTDIEVMEYSMEGVRAQIAALTPPKCAQQAQQLFVSYVDETLAGYNAVISGDTQVTYMTHLDNAAELFDQYHKLVLDLYPELSASPTPTP